MFSSTTLTALLLGALLSVHAAPLNPRLVKLDPAATAEAQAVDATATRALTATTIKTADGRCLNVVSGSGDFRENLTPVTAVACDGSKGQQWDVITAGKHNNVAGQALIVSSLTNACMNFDARRAPGNQVLLFSCGGRADGEGGVTDSQLFAFDAAKTAGVPLVPQSGKGAVVLTVTNGALDQAAGAAAQASGQELFTFGNAAAAPAPAPAPASSAAPANAPKPTLAPSATTPPPANTAVAGEQAVSRAGGKLDPTAAAEANQRDAGATRALADTTITTADGSCLSVDATAGDFRQNLIPVQAKACDGSAGQKWDVITKGVHNDQAGQALLVSTLTQGCLNFDARRAAGDQVLLFSCGGRADGEGKVTDSQLFAFDAAKTSNVPLAPQSGKGAVLLTVNGGALDQSAASASGNQLFSFGGAAAGGAPAPAPAPAPTTAEAAAPPPPAATQAPSSTVAPPASGAVSRAGGKLDPTAAAEANKRDASATRALSGAAIKTADGNCLSVDATAGDFRQNLIPVQAKACDGSAGQQWDVITKGVHNDQAGQALLVSALTQGCLNFDARRAPGDQVLLFSCGGRADGEGKVTDSQLFAFDAAKTSNVPLAPQSGKGAVLLTVNGGALDQSAGSAASASGNQLFTFA